MSDAVCQVKAERKRRESAERELRAAHEARSEAHAVASRANDQLKCVLRFSLSLACLHPACQVQLQTHATGLIVAAL